MRQLIESIFSLSENVRYAAIYFNGELLTASNKLGLAGASGSESDEYDELIVSPTILTLVKQRRDIDCGGVSFVLVRYGNFYQFFAPISKGHISIGIEPQDDPLPLVKPIQRMISQHGLQ